MSEEIPVGPKTTGVIQKVKYPDAKMGDPLDMLEEECSEVIKELVKARRFGLINGTPSYIAKGNKPPRDRIVQEIGDVLGVLTVIAAEDSLKLGKDFGKRIEEARIIKLARLKELFGYTLPQKEKSDV